MEINKVTIIGMGALGVMYGHHITKHLGSDACEFLADTVRIERYKKEQVFCNGEPCDFKYTDGVSGADGASEADKKAELLIFATKATGLASAIETARSMVGPDTILISILNGISSEDELAAAFGDKNLLYCVVQGMDATKIGNELKYSRIGEVRIGFLKDEPEKAPLLQEVLDFFDRAEIPYVKEDDIMYRLWGKWMLNVGINQTCMVYECGYGAIQAEGEVRDVVLSAMKEVLKLSEKAGIGLTYSEIDAYMDLIDTLAPDGMPSMRQDGVLRRYSEVELFAGTVIRKAEELGVDVPVNRELYRRVKEIEASYE